ncbi:MAG: class I SAM-dependent methyltransferase [Patescibacteria group bacterium]|nr:class I SAM-dependent methyltransferase [Patescibacteria group bacterium]
MRDKTLAKLKGIVAESYQLTADHFSNTRSKIAASDFIWAASQIKESDDVLDAGCGNGRLLDYVKTSPDKYLGIDQSQALVERAQQLHPEYSFKSFDLTESDLPSQKFSLIFCSAVLSHIPGKRARIKVLQDLLSTGKTGSRLLISFWKMNGKYKNKIYLNFLKKIIGQHRFPVRELVFPWKNAQGEEICQRYYHSFTKSSFRKEISLAGWKIEEERDDKHNYWLMASKK